MEFLLFNLEILFLSALLVGLYALKPRLGLLPFYMAMGLLFAFMMIGGRLVIQVDAPWGAAARYSLGQLAVLLAGMVLIYALEGTREARRMIGAVFIVSAFLIVLRVLVSWHLTRSGVDLAILGRERWVTPRVWSSIISMVALVFDGIAIIVVYQALQNLSGRIPQVVTLSIALIAAMVIDGLIYGSLSDSVALDSLSIDLFAKVVAGIAASVPIAVYIALQFKRHPEQMQRGVLERGAFEIVSLRRQVSAIREELAKSQAEYQHIRDIFSRYVMPDVVDEILKDASRLKLGGDLRDVTILFSDIRGYSTLSESMNPEETIELLNQYFGAMSEVITPERGTIIEFEGDAILTVFGAPLDQPDHAERAVRTAISMLGRVVELNRQWDEDGTSRHWRELQLATFKIRIGIHSGPVVVGNIGSRRRTKYAVIGDVVNTASRIEQINKSTHTSLLFSAATLERIGDPGETLGVEVQDMGVHEIRGRVEPVRLYTVKNLPTHQTSAVTGAISDELLEEMHAERLRGAKVSASPSKDED